MIKAINVCKHFDENKALDDFSTEIPTGCIYGLVGSNGAGKSTLLRLIAGIYSCDSGDITVNDKTVFEDVGVKNSTFFIADDLFFFGNYSMNQMAHFYSGLYANWSAQRYTALCAAFPIDEKKRINTFSKGMQRQVALILAVSTMPSILLLDEAFDGLDPVIRGLIRKILTGDVAERNMTVIISSHNLRELEDLCDQIGVLHNGKLLFQRELDDLKLGFSKVQCAFASPPAREAFAELDILSFNTQGSLIALIARGAQEDIVAKITALSPLLVESIPLSLEEVFIYEMEAVGYDYNNVLY